MTDGRREVMASMRWLDATYEPKNAPTFRQPFENPKGRKDSMIRFDLSIELDYNVLTQSDYVFIIQPTNTPYQRVTWESLSTEPMTQVQEEVHGSPANRHLRVTVPPGQ